MNKIIILENHKFDWTQKQIDQATGLFNSGIDPTDVAEIMDEKVISIGLLLIHLIDTGKVKKETIQQR